MKRIFSLALCISAVCAVNAQKAVVDQAAKLSGKNAQLEDARALIQQAMNDPETAKDARTYFVAGKLEFDAYDNSYKLKAINPNDPAVDPVEMAMELINGFNRFMQALPLDSVPDAKGNIKTKFSKDIVNKLAGHYSDYYDAGANLYNAKKVFPEAYTAFMVYGDMPEMETLGKARPIPNELRPTAYYNAGLAAWFGNQVELAAEAFKKARLADYDDKQAYTMEIMCWQNIAQNDKAREQEAKDNIMNIALAGYEKYGLDEPLFINNMTSTLVLDGKYDDALSLLNKEIALHPDKPILIGLRGWVYDRKGDDAASEADYRNVAKMDNVDFDTLKRAAMKIARIGQEKWNNIEGATEAERQNVKTNYYEAAMAIADKAANINPNDDDLNYLLDNIQYALDTYF